MKVTSFSRCISFITNILFQISGSFFVEFGKSIRLIFNQQEWESIPILFLDKSRLPYFPYLCYKWFSGLRFSENLSFLRESHKKLGWIPGFSGFPLIFEWQFSGKLRKSYVGWIRKNERIRPSYDFCDFISKMTIRLKNGRFEF